MAKPSEIRDPAFRAAIEEADRLLDEGKYVESVRKSADAYVELVEKRPDLLTPSGGRRASVWPQLGVRLVFDEGRKPSLVYDKERFSLSEAATFLEFAMDQVVRGEAGA